MRRRRLPDLAGLTVFDDRLRELATDERLVESAITEAVAALRQARRRGDRRDEISLLGYLGNAYRIRGRIAEAVAAFEHALQLVEELSDHRARVVAFIRLGEAHRCADAFGIAECLLRRALEESRKRPATTDLSDFALQHLGKCLLDQGQGGAATACFEEALELRKQKQDPMLIASTELALDRARAAASG